jgi:hypothetical protein
MGEVGRHPPAHTPDQPASTSAAAQVGAAPKTRHPQPTITTDPAKQKQQLQHMQPVILATERRKQLGTAKAAAGLPAIPGDPSPSDPDAEQNLPDAELPPTNQKDPPTIPPARQNDDLFYDIEADDGDLELSGTQLSGSKEGLEDPPNDEGRSKRATKATPPRRTE